jgi:hypothetical protein
MVRSFLALAILSLSSSSHAFIFNDFATPFPQLKELAETQTADVRIKVKLDIYDRKSKASPHLLLDGLELSLRPEKSAKGASVGLPGSEGPHPQTSSGSKAVEVHGLPYFIGMRGKEHVPMERGGWEMVWKKNAMAGTLICGFDVPIEVRSERPDTRLSALLLLNWKQARA